MKRFFPILAVLSFLLNPINIMAGEPNQGNGVAIDPQTGTVYPPISGELAVTPKWVYPFPGFTILKPPSIEPPRSAPHKSERQRSKHKLSQDIRFFGGERGLDYLKGESNSDQDINPSTSVSPGEKNPTSGKGAVGVVVFGCDGTQRTVHPSQAKKVFKDGTVVYGLDN